MPQYPYPKLTESGRFLLYTVGIVVGVVVMAALIVSCNRRPVTTAERPWGQGYETSAGYMQPDHGFMYYWMMNRLLWQDARPTYHVYYPPAGYPSYYRPWRTDIPNTVTYRPPTAVTPARTSGGFSSHPTTPSPRSTGGFSPSSSPSAAPSPSRSTGGFSSSPASSPRSTGGFSGSSKPSSASPSPSRTSGGFSKPSSPSSSPRSSGGFSKSSGGKK